jgi:hypothetical protein
MTRWVRGTAPGSYRSRVGWSKIDPMSTPFDIEPGTIPASVSARIEQIDAEEWDRVAAARRVADVLLEHGLTNAAASRLADSARSCDLAAQFSAAAGLWESIAAIDSLDEHLVDAALVRAARAHGATLEHRERRGACLEDLWALAEASGDDDRMARALYLKYLAAEFDGDSAARELLVRGAQRAETSGWVWQCRSLLASLDDDADAAVAASRRALALARASGDLQLELRAVDGIAWYESFAGSSQTAIEVYSAAVDLARRDGDLDAVLQGQLSLTHMHLHELQLDAADARIDQLARDVPDELARSWDRLVAAVRSNIARIRGRLVDALELGRTAAAELADDTSFRARDVVAIQAWFDAAIEVGALADARIALQRLLQAAERSGDAVARRDAEWARLRLLVADGADIDEEWLANLDALLASADMWLEGCIVADGARIAAWHGRSDIAAAIARGSRSTDADPLIELRRAEGRAIWALLVEQDVRPLRAVRRRMLAAGVEVDAARLYLYEAMVESPDDEVIANARHAFGELERAGAERDVLDALDVLPWLERSAEDWPARVVESHLLDGFGRSLAQRGVRARLDTGAVAALPDVGVVIVSGFVCLRDPMGACVGVAGPGSVVDVGAARADGAVELQAARAAELVGPTGDLDARDWWRADAVHLRPVLDTRIDARSRLERIIDALVDRWGSATETGTQLECGLSQSDLASLVGASRKTATLAIAQLRGEGRLEARRGVLSRR